MNGTKTIAIRLDDEHFQRLSAEARRTGVPPGNLAESYVRARLETVEPMTDEEYRRTGLEALKQLADFRQRLPDAGPVDAVQLIRDARSDLDDRFTI